MSVVEILAKTAEGVQERVGSTGSRSVHLSPRGSKLNAIILSRGGLIVDGTYDGQYAARRAKDVYTHGEKKGQLIYPNAPKLIEPVLDATVIYIGNHVGVPGKDGVRNDNPDSMVNLAPEKTRNYLLRGGDVWQAYTLSEEGVDSNYWTGMNTYYLVDAMEITTTEAALSVLSLLGQFDRGIKRAHDEALAWKS